MKKLALHIFVLTLFTSIVAKAQTINVPADQPTIQAALDLAQEGDTILVATGTYYENLIWPGDIDGISMIGVEGEEMTIIDGQGTDRVIEMETSFGVKYTSATRLQGFTIQNGYVFNDSGAGLKLKRGSPTFKNLIFKNNRGEGDIVEGAGAHFTSFEGKIEACIFIGNEIISETSASGSGLYVTVLDSLELINCHFDSNHAEAQMWANGGAVEFVAEANPSNSPIITIKDCTFTNNDVTSEDTAYGGAVNFSNWDEFIISIESSTFENNAAKIEGMNSAVISGGGALYAAMIDIQINNSTFKSNAAINGAAICFAPSMNVLSEGLILNSTFSENSTLTGNSFEEGGSAVYVKFMPLNLKLENCIVDHNESKAFILDIPTGDLILDHCTFAFNDDAIDIGPVDLYSTNSIFWNNGSSEFIHGGSSEIILQNCLVQNGFTGQAIIDADPEFIDEFLLVPSENSPCLNAGFSLSTNTDISGFPRPMPVNSFPDIGAYEIDQTSAHVQIKFFIDENENGLKDVSEQYFSLGSVIVNDEIIYHNYRDEGIYLIAQQGPLKLTFNEDWIPLWQLTNQSEYNFQVASENFSESIEYGLTALNNIADVHSYISASPFRCGEEVDFSLSLKNHGTTIAEGIVWLMLDNRVDEYFFSITPDYETSSHLVGWNFTDLLPGECMEIDFNVTSPFIENEDQVGDLYCFDSELEIEDNLRPNNFNYKAELRCAYDPNDKLVNPFREDGLALIESDLLYTIRFQNTGNDFARNVIVRDTLDSNLDMATFDIINSSHPDKLQVIITDERAIAFEFNGIYLPDSTSNEPASHGYINFSIRANPGVAINTNIKNTAHIYFDFNPAIVTNTTESIMVDEFPISKTIDQSELMIESYPNPTSDFIYLSSLVNQVRVYDLLGNLVIQKQNTDKVQVHSLEVGSYFVEYKLNGKTETDRWVIVK